jgi:HSP20 family protein
MRVTLVKHDSERRDATPRRLEFFDRFFDDLPEVLRRPVLLWPERAGDLIHLEEYTENGALVIKVELPGIDPDRDVEISIHHDVLHIEAQRREEETTADRDYVRRELRYGSFRRDLALPKGISESDVSASYRDGILEIRVPMPNLEDDVRKRIPIEKS